MTHRKLLPLALLALLTLPVQLGAQGFNGRARTYVSYLQVRNLVLDSVSAGDVPGEGSQRVLSDGTPVTCAEDYCQYYRSGSDLNVIPLLQDFEINAWPGIPGLRAYTHLRIREPLGDEEIWPRSQENFEVLAGYVEYSRAIQPLRTGLRIQAGRMWETTALGFYNYDGGSVGLRLPTNLDVTAYGGLSLVRGLNRPLHTDLISTVESLEPRQDAFLEGYHARWRPHPILAGSFTYQKETAANTGGKELYSERMAGSLRIQWSGITLDGEMKYDMASEETNLLRVALAAPLGFGLRGSAEYREYLPFFELWTIWGAFAPVGYDETRARLDWMHSSGRFSAYAYGSLRKFRDTNTDVPEGYEIRDDAKRIAGGGRVALQDDLILNGEYRYDEGYGASRSGGDLSLQKFFGSKSYLAVQGTAFETFSEFRVGSGQVYGGGILGAMPIGTATFQANAMFYKHIQNDRPRLLDLNQARVNLSLEIPIGRDPGMAGGGN